MSESCPKCGANRTQFDGQTSWECGSYQSLLGGSHIKRPAFKLIESEHCLCRTALAAATKRAEDLQAHYDRDTAKLQQEIARLTAANGGNYWRWQGDGGDYLESLTCPILIDVGQLHEIFSANREAVVRAEEAEAKIVSMRAGCNSTIENYRKQEHELVKQIAEFERTVAGCRDRIKEYREKIEQLETDKAFYHDKWLNALEQLAAAEQENARLREGIENLCVQQLKDENAALTAEVERLKDAANIALEHAVELSDAWMRGVIRESDGNGGLRSNRNADVEYFLRCAINGKDRPKIRRLYT